MSNILITMNPRNGLHITVVLVWVHLYLWMLILVHTFHFRLTICYSSKGFTYVTSRHLSMFEKQNKIYFQTSTYFRHHGREYLGHFYSNFLPRNAKIDSCTIIKRNYWDQYLGVMDQASVYDISIPCGQWFESPQVYHRPSSHQMAWEKQYKIAEVFGHRPLMEEIQKKFLAFGFWLQPPSLLPSPFFP